MLNLIPGPSSINFTKGEFILSSNPVIRTKPSSDELNHLAEYLAEKLLIATGTKFVIRDSGHDKAGLALILDADNALGKEGYELKVTEEGIELCASQPAGLFYAIQTLLQMIPPQPTGTVSLPAVTIHDTPRFAWRGAMLDVARHFFNVEDVKRYIDLISYHKLNRLHLHLTDDQGWRIEIRSWPRLTGYGARTQVGGNGGGFYTQDQYREIVEYAARRYVMIIPEIDTPGHTNAALASYAELNDSEEAPNLYEGIEVGFSSLSINKAVTYQFLDDVIRELAELTPGPYIHIGGDETHSTPEEDYKKFVRRIQEIVISHGKTTIGWAEIGQAELFVGTVAQHWVATGYQEAKAQGAKIILSPANKTYLDMKYDETTPLGLTWASLISVKDSYDWEPGTYMHLREEDDILGIEAPIWSETLKTMKDVEYLAFPRLLSIAELAWSPKGQDWNEFRQRIGKHGPRMDKLGINYYRSPEIDWEK